MHDIWPDKVRFEHQEKGLRSAEKMILMSIQFAGTVSAHELILQEVSPKSLFGVFFASI
jgi:hypothetical protein